MKKLVLAAAALLVSWEPMLSLKVESSIVARRSRVSISVIMAVRT